MASPIGFFFLLLTTSQLIIRPGAFSESLGTIPFVQIFIIPCLLFSVAGVLEELTGKSLSRNPISTCLLGFTLCHFFSSMINLSPDKSSHEFTLFIKSLIFYFLMLVNLKSRQRVIWFGIAYTFFILISTSVAMANYYHVVDMPGYKQLGENGGMDPLTGKTIYNFRLSGPAGSSTGDPNDFCLMILPAILFAGHFVLSSPRLWQKLLALISTATLFQAVSLTQSRGGMLGLMGGAAIWFVSRFGIKKSIPYIVIGALVLLKMVTGRQMDFSMGSGSGQVRIQIWLTCISLIKSNPVLGVGPGELSQYTSYVAHNSFVQAFAELGLPGGLCFLGVFFSAGWCLYRTRPHPHSRVSPALWQLRHLMLAILIGTVVSMNALSRTYAMETFVVVGLASSYYFLISDEYRDTTIRADSRLFGLLVVVSITFLLLVYIKVMTSI